MRKVGIVCVVAVFALSLAACGGNKEADQAKKAAEEAQKAAEQAAKAAESGGGSVQEMAKGMEQFAKSMEQLQKGADGKSYEPVSFKSLQEVLPAIDGWEKGETEGETMSSPVKFSQATTSYSKGDARIEVKVVDTAMSQLLTMPYQMFLLANYSKESSKGYEKAGRPRRPALPRDRRRQRRRERQGRAGRGLEDGPGQAGGTEVGHEGHATPLPREARRERPPVSVCVHDAGRAGWRGPRRVSPFTVRHPAPAGVRSRLQPRLRTRGGARASGRRERPRRRAQPPDARLGRLAQDARRARRDDDRGVPGAAAAR
jgi:hypothetical protein